MNKIIIIHISLFLALCLPGFAQAQNQKTGFIDSDVIMEQMPEYTGIEQRLELLSSNWRQEIRELEEEIAELEQDFEAREILFTDEIREQRLEEISIRKENLQRFIEEKFGPDGEYFTTQQDLLAPIQRQIFDALQEVAQRDAYDFVFDRARDSRFIYVSEEWDLTEDVMIELGLDVTGN